MQLDRLPDAAKILGNYGKETLSVMAYLFIDNYLEYRRSVLCRLRHHIGNVHPKWRPTSEVSRYLLFVDIDGRLGGDSTELKYGSLAKLQD